MTGKWRTKKIREECVGDIFMCLHERRVCVHKGKNVEGRAEDYDSETTHTDKGNFNCKK